MRPLFRLGIYGTIAAAGGFWLYGTKAGAYPVIDAFAAGAVSTIPLSGLDALLARPTRVWLWLKAKFIYPNAFVRLSISYLIRIKLDDKYLLIRGSRIPDQFQPVGGVYKRLRSAEHEFRRLGVLDDEMFSIDQTNKDDLRVRVKGRHVPAFIEWFESGREREIGPWREFFEEMVADGPLSRELFAHGQFEFVKRRTSGMKFSPYVQAQEILIADIFEFHPTQAQEASLRELLQKPADNLLWTDESEIRRLTTSPKGPAPRRISPTAEWLI